VSPALQDRTAVITGAAGALGSAIARRYLDEGARALGLVDRDEDALRALRADLRARPGRGDVELVPMALDVTDEPSVVDAVAAFADRVGALDVAVNNAGVVAPSARIHHVRIEDLRRVLDINVTGVFTGMKAAIAVMRPAGGGAIVNTASVAGFTAWTHSSPYCASKAAVIQLTKVAAVEYAAEGIRVNCVSPGTFLTRFHDDLTDDALADVRARHRLGRFGTAEEIAAAFAYLASPDAAWVTGTNLVIDGGLSAG
jgi:NAD(P)-dependent dehydrogenase (short-subunit alcohol dehydrogenase family)